MLANARQRLLQGAKSWTCVRCSIEITATENGDVMRDADCVFLTGTQRPHGHAVVLEEYGGRWQFFA